MDPPHEASAKFANALGESVVRIWGHLPPEIQHKLFKEAASRAEEIAARSRRRGHLTA